MIKKIWNWIKEKWYWFVGIITILFTGGTILYMNVGGPIEPPCITFQGEEICFNYTDDNTGEDLIIRTEKQTYNELIEADVFLMVKNESGKTQEIDLQIYMPDKEKRNMAQIERLKFDMPYQVEVYDYEDVEYPYTCSVIDLEMGESSYCVSDPKECKGEATEKTCIRKEKTGSHLETRYRDELEIQDLTDIDLTSTELKAKKKNTFTLMDNEIIYFKAKIKFPNQVSEEFFIETKGNLGGNGFLR